MPTLQTVLIPVQAYVPDAPGGGEGPPGIWGGGNVPMPTPPIHLPGTPPGIWGGGNVPMPTPPIHLPGTPPGIWGGGNVPMPTPPIYLPPQGGGRPEHPIFYPPGIWGPTDPRPGWGLPGPQPPAGRPEHPIFYPPGIWGPTDPRPGWGLPEGPPGIWGGGNVPMPTPPIHLPGSPPGIWGPTDPRPGWGLPEGPPGIWGGGNVPMPNPPIQLPGPGGPPPVFDPDSLPDHPEVPDLNAGNWLWIVDEGQGNNEGRRGEGQTGYTAAFVPWPLAVTHPDYNPQYPPEDMQPGEWVIIIVNSRPMNAWMPSKKGGTPAPAKASAASKPS